MPVIRTIITIWQRELIRYTRDKARIASSLIQPLMFLAIFGVGLQSAFAQQKLGFNFIQFMFPGIVAMSVMGVAFFSTISTVWDREFGFLKEILVAPVPRTAIALGKTLGATTIAGIQAFLLLVLAPFIGLTPHFSVMPELIGILFLVAFSISGLGLLIASHMRTMEGFGILMQLLVFPMFFLSGAFFPLTSVPTWMAVVARLDPLTYGVDALRQIVLGPEVSASVIHNLALYAPTTDALFLVAFSTVMIAAAVTAFNHKM